MAQESFGGGPVNGLCGPLILPCTLHRNISEIGCFQGGRRLTSAEAGMWLRLPLASLLHPGEGAWQPRL